MIRVVLAVVLTTALLGVSLPAIDDARRDHTETTVRTELQRLERAATNLLDMDDPTDDGARRVVTIKLPARSWTDVGIACVAVGPARTGSGGRLTWAVEGGTRRVRRLPRIPIRTADGDALTINASGRHRLVLSLDGVRRDPVVTVRRFTNHEEPTGVHARVAIDPKPGDSQ